MKSWLNLSIQKAKIMASGPIISWQIEGEKWKQWQVLFSWTPKALWMVTAAMKLRHMPLGRKAMTNLDNMLKSRDITWPTKVHTIKAMVFPVVMYGCESWTIKKTECQRTDAFELWFWIRLLSVPWTARRSNQSILKEINSDCSLKGLLMKMKLQYLGPLMQRADSLERTLMLRKIDGKKRRGQQNMRWPSVGTSASASDLPMNIQGWFPLGLTGLISLQTPRQKYADCHCRGRVE